MKNELALSTWSLHNSLGPLHLTYRGPDGHKAPIKRELPGATGDLDLLDFPRLARERLGVAHVEICQMHIPTADSAYLAALAAAISDAGVSLIGMPIDVGNISDADDAHREEDLAEVEAWIDVAAGLGARMVRVNASSFGAGALAPLVTTIASYRRLSDRAMAGGMKMLIENHGGITADPETIVRIVEAVGTDRLATCVDTGNFAPVMGAQSGAVSDEIIDQTPLERGIARIVPFAGIVHAKTSAYDAEGRHRVWDPARALRVVRDAGYTGPISIEYGGGQDEWTNAGRTMRLVEELFG